MIKKILIYFLIVRFYAIYLYSLSFNAPLSGIEQKGQRKREDNDDRWRWRTGEMH